jgi:superfamily I DNA/RNA helicase
MAFAPTQEQEKIVKAAKTLKNLRIQAYAGAGKSSTLRLIAQALPKHRGIYLTFNKALANEAQEFFPDTVQCSTVHSLAFRALRPKIASSPKEFVVTTIEPILKDFPSSIRSKFAWAVHYSLTKFCYSDYQEVDEDCLYNSGLYEEMDDLASWWTHNTTPSEDQDVEKEVRAVILLAVKQAWHNINLKCDTKVTHDIYLKQFEIGLQEGDISCDYVCLDEAQDSSDVIISIVRKIGKPSFIVGDSFQQIYEWRGAKNALEKVEGVNLFLSKSFRFGPELANFASDMLGLTEHRIEGHGTTGISHAAGGTVDAVIARTNKAVFDAASSAHKAGLPARMPHAMAIRNDFEKLCNFMSRKTDRYCGFTDPNDLLDRIKKDPQTISNGWMLQYLNEPGSFMRMLETLAKATKGTMYSTAHRSKGMEWDKVYVDVASWLECKSSQEEDLRTLYVAVTRAKKHLFINVPKEDVVAWSGGLRGV